MALALADLHADSRYHAGQYRRRLGHADSRKRLQLVRAGPNPSCTCVVVRLMTPFLSKVVPSDELLHIALALVAQHADSKYHAGQYRQYSDHAGSKLSASVS